MIKTRAFLVLAMAFVLCGAAFAWEPFNVELSGSLYFDGFGFQLRTDTQRPFELEHSARTTYFGRQSKYLYYGRIPDADMETVAIGLGGLRCNVLDQPCSGIPLLADHYGVFQLCPAFRPDGLDYENDWNSVPLATSPPVLIPAVGYTSRTFFSSLSRPQGNSWDDFVVALRSQFLPGDAFVLRFVPLDGAGFIVYDQEALALMAYSSDLSSEEDFLDSGDTRILLLQPADADNFSGVLLRGACTRDRGTNQPLLLTFRSFSGTILATKTFMLPWLSDTQENQTTLFGVRSNFINQNPGATITGNEWGEGVTVQCRVDHLTAVPSQP